ncbi:MAG: extracellular solute-binding protein [Lysobacter sp.]|nr:extracellular solute-binding protein [Lysobacter sp.]
MNRNIGTLMVGAMALVGLASCGKDAAPEAAAPEAAAAGPQVLNVYNWPDYIAEDTIRNFEAKTGIKVNYDLYSNNEVLEQKLAASPDAYDVIFPSAQPYAQRMIATGGLASLDKTRLGNLKHIDAAILAELGKFDAGNSHVVPYMWGTTGLGINVGKVQAVLGAGAPLDSWSLLFDPATAAKLSSCGIGLLDNELESFSPALIWKGRDPNDFSADANTVVRDIYAAIRPHIRKYGNDSELIEGLANGELCLVLSFSGDVQQAQARAQEMADTAKTKAPEIRYVIPREGAMRWTDVVAIPKSAKNIENAHRFLQYLMEPEVIADISNFVAYANANTSATDLLDDAVAEDPGIYPPADVRAKLSTARPPTEAEAKERKLVWNNIIYGLM